MVFHMLRWVMGDESFKVMLREFLKQNADSAVKTSQLEKTAEAVSKVNLEPFFAQWLDRTGAPNFSDKYTVYRLGSNKGFRTVGEITQDLDLFRMPVQLRIETDGRTEDKRVEVVGTSSPYQEDTFGRPRRILVDPDDWVLKNSPEMQLRVAILRGQQLVGQGDLTGALTEYQKALQVNSTSSLASYRIARGISSSSAIISPPQMHTATRCAAMTIPSGPRSGATSSWATSSTPPASVIARSTNIARPCRRTTTPRAHSLRLASI